MTLEAKASFEKQPDWIDTCAEEISRIELPRMTCKSNIKKLIQKHLPQTSYCSNTQEDTYQMGYQKGREDMKKEMEGKHQYIRFGQLARFLLTIPMGKVYGYASKDYILKIEKMPYMDAEKPTVGYVDDGFDERIDNKSSD